MKIPSLAALAALALAAYSPAHAKDVTLVTDFGVNGRHAYFFVALNKGYYKEAGLDVTIVRGGGSADAIKKVAAGKAEIGFADAGALVLARGNDGVPVKLVSIAYASPPQAIYALAGSGIKSPKDLEGRKVTDTASSAMRVLFGAYAKAAGIQPDRVTWQVADGDSLPSLLATGRADAIGQFTVGEPLLEKAVAPQKLVRLAYRDAGLNYYGNGLIASEDMIKSDPDTIRKFVAATLRGMQEAFRDPDEAGRILNHEYRQIDPAIGAGETRLVQELATVPGQPLGTLDPKRVAETVSIISAAYPLKQPVKPEDMYAPGFTPQ